MPDATATVVTKFTGQDQLSPVIRKVNGELKGFQKAVGGVSSAVPVFNKLATATGGLITPTTLLIGGGVALAGAFVDAAKAAAEEEVNVAKLSAALKANIPGWDGSTAAIERLISAREMLAFSDDELRDSLARLVGATHDVAKAEEIQRTAMDLARFKGISLEQATQALIKVEGGQYRALKELGIVTDENIDQTTALAAVQKVASGQAEAYGKTITGQSEAIRIKMQDMEEQIGGHLIPVIYELERSLLRALDPSLISAADAAEAAGKGSQAAAAKLRAMGHTAETTAGQLNAANRAAVKGSMAAEARVRTLTSAFWRLRDATAAATRQLHRYGGSGTVSGAGTFEHRAVGGPVRKGQAYLVGERNPEVFVPDRSGTILPNVNRLAGSSQTAMGGSSGATVVNLAVNVAPPVGMTPATARSIGDAVGPVVVDYFFRRGIIDRRA